MNLLAHLHLAEPTPESRLGNLLGDFVKGVPWDARYPDAVWQGIVEHRRIDVFTDGHPVWRRSRDLLPPDLRRFAGIVVDIYYDYFLTRHWSSFQPGQDLVDFVAEVHRGLERLLPMVEEPVRDTIRQWISENWLLRYGSLDGIREVIAGVSQRTRVPDKIVGAARCLDRNLTALEEHFLAYYPCLLEYAASLRAPSSPAGPG